MLREPNRKRWHYREEAIKRFEEYCLPKKNLEVEKRKFFWKNQHDDKTFDQFMAEPRNLASTCNLEI